MGANTGRLVNVGESGHSRLIASIFSLKEDARSSSLRGRTGCWTFERRGETGR